MTTINTQTLAFYDLDYLFSVLFLLHVRIDKQLPSYEEILFQNVSSIVSAGRAVQEMLWTERETRRRSKGGINNGKVFSIDVI